MTLRLLGVPKDDPDAIQARHHMDRAVGIPSWRKSWLSILSLYDWQGVNSLLPELWYVIPPSIGIKVKAMSGIYTCVV